MSPHRSTAGLVQGGLGGLGGAEDQLLEAGQEEVFARAEVESGRIEHHTDTQPRPSRAEVEPSSPTTAKGASHG